MSRAPYRPGDPIRALHLEPEHGTCLIGATVTACTPRGDGRWTVHYRTSSGSHGRATTTRTGHSDYLLPGPFVSPGE